MNNNSLLKEKLKEQLKEIFQFDNGDLDFGIYRIMNYKQKEIEKFIENDLINEITKQLNMIDENEKKELKEKIEEAKKKVIESLGENAFDEEGKINETYKETPVVKQYLEVKAKLQEVEDKEDLERDVYNYLIEFFTRYYDDGDFVSVRRYGNKERYVVPYNGEEVYLHWVNKDQYYIKTSTEFKKYTFYIDNISSKLTVNFIIVEAEEEKGNEKENEKKFFVLNDKILEINEYDRELNIYFEFRRLTDSEKKKLGDKITQDVINKVILEKIYKGFLNLNENLGFRIIFEKQEDGKSLIEKHLNKYTKKNTTDYFIHKDLNGFLERELDFFIKNEALKLENIDIVDETQIQNLLLKAKVFKNIASKIIKFLSQIEEFQKKLWKKKKIVIDTHYVITLDKINEYAGREFLENVIVEILNNEKQKEEWKELFDLQVNSIEDLIDKEGNVKKLPIDTKYFSEDFKWNLIVELSKKENLDDILDGVLIKSENWQALNLIINKYAGKVQTIYIDPPFNKEQEADYLYKVNYKDSTWLCLLENRLEEGKNLLNEKGCVFVRCDYNGNMYIRLLMNKIFGKGNFVNEIAVNRTKKIFIGVQGYNVAIDSLFFYSKNPIFKFYPQYKKRNKDPKWINMHSPGERKPPERIIMGRLLYPPKGRHWTFVQERIYELEKQGRIRINEEVEYIDMLGNLIKGMPQYFMSEMELLDSNWTDIPGYSQTQNFSTENSEILLKRVIESTSDKGDIIMDFFLGSGTTIAVAHKLKRKWIGIEMGEHFNTVIMPRMKKVLFYDKSGITKENDVKEIYNSDHSGGFYKYHTLEQYEDTLENIEFNEINSSLYKLPDYFIKYFLDWETKDSNVFLNIERAKDPFNYKLKIFNNYKVETVNVDLVETFNYLLGLNVNRYKVIETNNRKYVFVFGERDERQIAIVWRNIKDIDFEEDKKVINKNISEFNPEVLYVNGDCIVENFKAIEPEFKTLMFTHR